MTTPASPPVPNTELPDQPVTLGELFRGVNRLSLQLDRVERKVEGRPTQEELDRRDAARDRADQVRDAAIRDLEDQMTAAMRWIITSLGAALLALVMEPVLAILGR